MELTSTRKKANAITSSILNRMTVLRWHDKRRATSVWFPYVSMSMSGMVLIVCVMRPPG